MNDIRYALRSVMKAPAFGGVAVATLALGIGANAAVFSASTPCCSSRCQYADAQGLARIYLTYRGDDNYMPGPALDDFRARSRTLDIAGLYTYRAEGVDLTDRAQPERVGRLQVTADYFRVLRVNLVAGHPFEREDERPAATVAVVSSRIWKDYFSHGADAIGRTLTLNAAPCRVEGVMPESYEDSLQPDVEVWTPLDNGGRAR